MTTHLYTALAKLDRITTKGITLTPQEAVALRQYIAGHGISGRWAVRQLARRERQKTAGKVRP